MNEDDVPITSANDPNDIYENIKTWTPEEVLDAFVNELKHSSNSIKGCVSIMEVEEANIESASSKMMLQRVIQILRGNVEKVEGLRQGAKHYLQSRTGK